MIALSNLSIKIHGNIKNSSKTMNLKYQLQHGMINLNYLTDRVLYQIFKITVSIFPKKHGEKTDNPSIRA